MHKTPNDFLDQDDFQWWSGSHINPNLVCSQSKYEFHFNDICVEQGLSTNHLQIEPTD